MAGLAARSERERVAAKQKLADLTLEEIVRQPLIDPDTDDVSRLLLDTMRHYLDQAVEVMRAQVGKERVILGLSGGVDSSVAAALIHRAIGDHLTCIFVNNGLLRAREAEKWLMRLHVEMEDKFTSWKGQLARGPAAAA